MMASIKTSIVRIGNSQGIRIPKTLLEQCHLHDEMELEPRDGYLILKSARKTREGWDKAFQAMANQGDDAMINGDVILENTWDKDEWVW
jgi:antitoxin MazE